MIPYFSCSRRAWPCLPVRHLEEEGFAEANHAQAIPDQVCGGGFGKRSYRIPAHQPARARHFCRPNVAIRAMSIVSSQERRSGVTLCVEGNISAGKSTFLSDIIEGSKVLKVRFPQVS